MENLASALLLEQSQRLKKEKILEKLLLDESAARFKAEQVSVSALPEAREPV